MQWTTNHEWLNSTKMVDWRIEGSTSQGAQWATVCLSLVIIDLCCGREDPFCNWELYLLKRDARLMILCDNLLLWFWYDGRQYRQCKCINTNYDISLRCSFNRCNNYVETCSPRVVPKRPIMRFAFIRYLMHLCSSAWG